ncbi:MAG: ATP-binding protein [Chitinophagaceae bacterium]
MQDSSTKNMAYAANLESLLKNKAKRDFKSGFDFAGFLEDFTKQAAASNLPNQQQQTSISSNVHESSLEEYVIHALMEAEEMAALSGKFDPEELKYLLQTDTKVLTRLSPNCIINNNSELRWELKRQRRIPVLKNIITENRLQYFTGFTLPRTDAFGNLLRKVLFQDPSLIPAQLAEKEKQILVNVLETVSELDIPKPSIKDIRETIQLPGIQEEYSLITKDFVGRNPDLALLKKFLEKKTAGKGLNWSGLILTGMGGVGKSSLAAKFLETVIKEQSAIVSILDFDRPGISLTDRFWLVCEICKQVGSQCPSTKNEINQSIEHSKIQRDKLGLSFKQTSEQTSDMRLVSGLLNDLKKILNKHKLQHLPFLLIMDTVEEITRNSYVSQVHYWINELSESLHPIIVKVIFSGRLYNEHYDQFKAIPNNTEEIILNEFDNEIAQVFLRGKGVDEETTRKIISQKIIPLRPLELKLTAQCLNDGSITIEQINKELTETKGKSKTNDFAAGIIYRRVLKRIADPQLQAIAYPGLILRYITPKIIVEVLQPALELRKLTENEALDITNRLATYSWLANREGEKVWHQKELRRAMLRLMIRDKSVEAKKIRSFAIKYFEKIGTKEARAEIVYHKLMEADTVTKAGKLEISEIKQAFPFIKADRPDFPKVADVLTGFAITKNVSFAEMKYLPPRYLIDLYLSTGKQLVRKRDFLNAYQLYQNRNKTQLYNNLETEDLLDNWEKDTLFALVKWKELDTSLIRDRSAIGYTPVWFINYLYPNVITNPACFSSRHIEALLKRLNSSFKKFWPGLSKDTRNIFISRLTVAVLILNGKGRINVVSRALLKRILENIEAADPTPISYKDLSILSMLVRGKPMEYYYADISQVKIEEDWMNNLMSLPKVKPVVGNKVLKILRDHRKYSWKNFSVSLNLALSEKNGISKIKTPISKLPKKEIAWLLAGPQDFFRDPFYYAIVESFKSKKDFKSLSTAIHDSMNFEFSDCTISRIQQQITGDPAYALPRYIEMIDRCWNLYSFLTLLLKLKPKSKTFQYIRAAFINCNTSYEKLFKIKNKLS